MKHRLSMTFICRILYNSYLVWQGSWGSQLGLVLPFTGHWSVLETKSMDIYRHEENRFASLKGSKWTIIRLSGLHLQRSHGLNCPPSGFRRSVIWIEDAKASQNDKFGTKQIVYIISYYFHLFYTLQTSLVLRFTLKQTKDSRGTWGIPLVARQKMRRIGRLQRHGGHRRQQGAKMALRNLRRIPLDPSPLQASDVQVKCR